MPSAPKSNQFIQEDFKIFFCSISHDFSDISKSATNINVTEV